MFAWIRKNRIEKAQPSSRKYIDLELLGGKFVPDAAGVPVHKIATRFDEAGWNTQIQIGREFEDWNVCARNFKWVAEDPEARLALRLGLPHPVAPQVAREFTSSLKSVLPTDIAIKQVMVEIRNKDTSRIIAVTSAAPTSQNIAGMQSAREGILRCAAAIPSLHT